MFIFVQGCLFQQVVQIPFFWYSAPMKQTVQKCLSAAAVAALLPDNLSEQLASVQKELGSEIYLVGGTVRDLLLGRQPGDLDLTVARDAAQWAKRLRDITGGTYVELGREEDAARVVLRKGLDVDFSSFRAGARSIEEDLKKNKMAG